MPVPTALTDLDVVAANNSPPGTESAKGNIDNYLRAAFAFIKQNSIATQTSMGNFGGYKFITGSATLTAADAGKYIAVTGINTIVTLPAGSALTPGATFSLIFNSQSGMGITTTGSDTIAVAGAIRTLPITFASTDLQLTWRGDIWEAHSGSATLKYEPQFSATIAASGYQKLPSGLIIQWGSVVSGADGGAVANFPATFPTAAPFNVSATAIQGGSTPAAYVSAGQQNQSNMIVRAATSSGVAAGTGITSHWMAIGY